MGRLEVELRRHSGVLWLRRGSAEQCFLDLKHGSGESNQDHSGMESNPSTDRHRRVCLSQWSRPLGIWGTRSSVKISVLWVPTRFWAVTLLPAKELPPRATDSFQVLPASWAIHPRCQAKAAFLGFLWGTHATPSLHNFLHSPVVFLPVRSRCFLLVPVPHLGGGCLLAKYDSTVWAPLITANSPPKI